MNALITLLILCCVYYIGFRYFPERFTQQYHLYFGIFVSIYLVIYYFLVFQTDFSHKLLRNIYDSSQQPLYTFNAQKSNADLYYRQNPNADIKATLLMKQGSRCQKCQNYLVNVQEGLLTYKIPLQHGGPNDPSNISVICPTCHMFL